MEKCGADVETVSVCVSVCRCGSCSSDQRITLQFRLWLLGNHCGR